MPSREYEPFWIEDPVRADDLDALAEINASMPVPVTASETIGGHWRFRELCERRAADIVTLDVS